ncbi:MAG: hypothetical protein NTX93_09190 [Bacteroidia bacterium]|nr:hypothetical protein [Bacteroidia bacterium]
MRTIKYLFIILITALTLGSCRKIVQLSAVPHIEFTSFTVFDTLDILGNSIKGGRLKFYFEDGDGDLGLEEPTGNQTDSTNMFFTLFRKTGGNMVPAPDNDPLKPSSYRIPYMERLGQNKILKGTISVTFLYTFYKPGDSNIIRYDFFIKDRADNKSNTVSTCEIPLSVNGLYEN